MTNSAAIGSGAKLRAAREAAGLTQAELAEKLGTSPQWISGYERGHERGANLLSLDKIHEIALAIGCDPHSIDRRLASVKSR